MVLQRRKPAGERPLPPQLFTEAPPCENRKKNRAFVRSCTNAPNRLSGSALMKIVLHRVRFVQKSAKKVRCNSLYHSE